MTSTVTPHLKLWYSPGACSFVPHVALLEAGLDAELILAQVGSMTDDFAALNPKQRVPVLAINNEVITEMSAVLTAISSLAPDRKLFGHTTLEGLHVYEWLNYLSTTVHCQAFGGLWRPQRFVNDSKLYPSLREKALETINECFLFIDDRVSAAGTTYCVGDSFTVVDPFLVLFYRWGIREKFDMEANYPSYAAFVKRLLERQSVMSARKIHVNV